MEKPIISLQLAEAGEKTKAVQASLDKLLDRANDDTERMEQKIRAKMIEARYSWEAVANPAQLNRLIQEFFGPSLVTVEGVLLPVPQMTPPTDGAVGGVRGFIAGGGFEPPTSGL
jgi:hypothetical protein